jgi:Flp pilus assembly protein TadD
MNIDKVNHRAYALYEAGDVEEAEMLFKKVLQSKPGNFIANAVLGEIRFLEEKFDKAQMYYRKALNNINPAQCDKTTLIQLYSRQSTALLETCQHDKALTYLQKIIALNPQDPAVMFLVQHNLGICKYEKGLLAEAEAEFRKLLEFDPEHFDIHGNLAQVLLLQGNFQEGWKERSWLQSSAEHNLRSYYVALDEWDGSPGKKIFVSSIPGGLGDEIMYISCLQEVVDQSESCILECDHRLIPLLKRSFPDPKLSYVPTIKAKESFTREPELSKIEQTTDNTIVLENIPLILRPNLESFPGKAYLVPDPEKVKDWKQRLKQLGDGLKVGISWRGGAAGYTRRKRSITFDLWEPILKTPGVHFINLQYGNCTKDLQDVKENFGVTVHDWPDVDPLKDIETPAAQISALDLVVSIDNTTVHVAGALGVPTWVLLPFIPNWRWGSDTEKSYWYPSLRLFRQAEINNWEELIERVAYKLRIQEWVMAKNFYKTF